MIEEIFQGEYLLGVIQMSGGEAVEFDAGGLGLAF